MAYDTFEESVETSAPVEVYEFVLGAEFFNYTSSEEPITIGATDYTPLAIKHGARVESPEERKSVFEIDMPIAGTIAERYILIVPGQRATVKVKRFQKLDTPTPEVIQIFDGSVRSVTFDRTTKTARIGAQPLIAATTRPAPRMVYSAACGHVLYDSRCKVNPNDVAFRFIGTVAGINDRTLTVPGLNAFANGWFTAGFVEAFGGQDARLILEHTGDDIRLHINFPTPVVGTQVTVRAGCAHDPTTCVSKFNNFINYGGHPFVPLKNPFESGIL